MRKIPILIIETAQKSIKLYWYRFHKFFLVFIAFFLSHSPHTLKIICRYLYIRINVIKFRFWQNEERLEKFGVKFLRK